MTWARWNPGKWHRIARRYENVTHPEHPYAPIVTTCGRWMREPDHERDERPSENVCGKCER